MIRQIIGARRNQHTPPVRGRIRRLERRLVIGYPVTNRAVILDINPVHHVAQERAGNILDLEIVNADHPAGRPRQIQPEMPIGRRAAPLHVHTVAHTRADNRRNRHHLAIRGQRHAWPDLDQSRHMVVSRIPGPTGNAHIHQVAAHRLDLDGDAQIAPRQDRCLPHIAQLLYGRGFLQFQTTAKIRIRRHKGRIGRIRIGILPCQPVLTGPHIQPAGKLWRCKNQPVGDRFVHPNPFPHIRKRALAHSTANGANGRHQSARISVVS